MKKVFLVLAALGFFAISQSSSAEEQKFKFGISAPLSGILAEYGTAVRNGVALAQKDAAQLSNVEVIFEDSQWDPKTAIAAFNTLKDAKKVSLVYNWGNPTSEAVAPVAERYKVPTIVMSSDEKVTKNLRYVVRTIPSTKTIGKVLAEHLISKGYHSIGVVMAENSYVRGLYEGVADELKRHENPIELVEQCPLDQQDFKSVITKIKQKKYDALGVLLITGQISSFIKQSDTQNLNLPLFGADFFGSKTEITAAGPRMEGAVFPDLGVTKEFRERYFKIYGNDIQIAFAANAYDVATMVGILFGDNVSPSLSPEEIIGKVRTVKNLKGAHGDFSYQESLTAGAALVTPIVIREVKDGDIVDLYQK